MFLKHFHQYILVWNLVLFISARLLSAQIQVGNPNDNLYNNPARMGLGMKYQSGSFVSELSSDEKNKLFYSESWEKPVTINGSTNLTNVNYSLYDEALVFKISVDSIYIFDKAEIDDFLIEDSKFERHYLGSSVGVVYLEVLYRSSLAALYKRHYMEFESRADAPDPLMIRDDSEFSMPSRKIAYFLSKADSNPIAIKLNKKSVLQSFKEKKKELLQKASSNKLSFRKEDDVVELLDHLEKNQKKE